MYHVIIWMAPPNVCILIHFAEQNIPFFLITGKDLTDFLFLFILLIAISIDNSIESIFYHHQ
ncbi:hypothetical protein DERP_010814 [Dermatophagoides pteronyssinus]|uniref:Uncharacterized protein n=1 Tax=Dermatophagoides pteronyssinus TaxID=6956 RepID=A0ABQ8J789_DERPT|nr:hypothetical protein DERP_010814 [Dermatophagoides pteronyssinus]